MKEKVIESRVNMHKHRRKSFLSRLSVFLATFHSPFSILHFFLLLALAACNTQDNAKPPLSLESVPQRNTPPENDIKEGYVHTDPKMKKKVAAAKQELATRLNQQRENIEVLEARYVTWRDASLGCPRAGQAYAQVLTSGARIKLRVDNRIYHYHSGRDRPPFLCEHPSPNEPLPYDFGDA